jgi:glycerophosphoryl diester phosphodiesterase
VRPTGDSSRPRELVAHAHRTGIKVVPWTINDPATINKLIDDGVDGIISDYPDRLRQTAAQRGFRLPRAYPSPLDIQGHRGAGRSGRRTPWPRSGTRWATRLCPQWSLIPASPRNGHLVVTHDRTVNGSHCVDTAPARPGDSEFPYVGKRIHDLTLRQLKTLDCGSKTLPEFPRQQAVPGERIPTLAEVFDLVRASGRADVRLNIETKIRPLVDDTADYLVFTAKLVHAIEQARLTHRATIQSFDWRTIRQARQLHPHIETVALVWQYGPAECTVLADECSLQAVYGDPSVRSPWTAHLDWWRVRDLGVLTRQIGASTVSANWQVHDPNLGQVTSPDWYLKEDPAYFHGPEVATLQQRHRLKVVTYTINEDGRDCFNECPGCYCSQHVTSLEI